MKKEVRLVAAALLIALGFAWWLAPDKRETKPKDEKRPVSFGSVKGLGRGRVPTDRSWNSQLENHAKRSAVTWAQCLRNENLPNGRVSLEISWDGSSHLVRIRLKPEVSHAAQECMEGSVKQWHLPAHPSLKPYSYRQSLVLGG